VLGPRNIEYIEDGKSFAFTITFVSLQNATDNVCVVTY
jgi:hypothetical protein